MGSYILVILMILQGDIEKDILMSLHSAVHMAILTILQFVKRIKKNTILYQHII